MKNTMILLAMLLTAFTAAANVDDDTIKVSRVMLGGDVSKVSIAGYANVSIVDDTINYLTTEHPLIGSGDDKRYTYTINSQKGLMINAMPGACNLVLHLVQKGGLEIFTEDFATVTMSHCGNLSLLKIMTSDYSTVSVMPNGNKDTLRVGNLDLSAEDFSKLSVVIPCAGDMLRMKSEDYATLNVSYFRGATIYESVSDFAKLNIDGHDGVTHYIGDEMYSDVEEFSEKVRAKVEKKSHGTNKPGFHMSFAWAFNNWGDAPLNGLNGTSDPYALGTTFSSYQLALMYTPLNVKHWTLGIGAGYESDVYHFAGNDYISVGVSNELPCSTFYSKEFDNAEWSSRLVARYVTMPVSVMWKPTKKFGICLAAIPGLNYTSSNTGLNHKGRTYVDNTKITDREDVSRVMNPYKLDARLTLVFTNIGVFLQVPTMPVLKDMDRYVYPLKFGLILGM